MAIITNSGTEDTAFTPSAAGDFTFQCVGGSVELLRKTASGTGYSPDGVINGTNVIVSNPTAGTSFKWRKISGTPVCWAE